MTKSPDRFMAVSHKDMLKIALSAYLGEVCPYCKKEFKTLGDLKDTVWCPTEFGRIAHEKCYKENKK
jgi:hypothetical protein